MQMIIDDSEEQYNTGNEWRSRTWKVDRTEKGRNQGLVL
jgi:hypothetical protein